MTHRPLLRQALFFLAVAACLSAVLQLTVQSFFPAPTAGALGRAEASWVAGSACPAHGADQEPGRTVCPSSDSLYLAPGLPATPWSQQRRILATDRIHLARGFSAEIYHPPVGIL
jgi:hypothetical protein